MAKANSQTESAERVQGDTSPGTRKAFEDWATTEGTPTWLSDAARVKFALPQGRPVSESEFRDMLDKTQNESLA